MLDLVKDWKYFLSILHKNACKKTCQRPSEFIHTYFQNTNVEITKNHFCQNILGHFGHNVFDAACLEVASFVLLD